MRILVCGGRDYNNEEKVFEILDDFDLDKIDLIISGLAKGADSLAEKWAITYGVPFVGYAANWKKEGKKAGFIRNRRMLEREQPDLVIAFPGGKGTANMIKLAQDANVPVHIISDASQKPLEGHTEV